MARTKNYQLGSTVVRNRIFAFLGRHVPNYCQSEQLITPQQIDNMIERGEHVVSPQISGVRSWIIIFREEDKYYAVNFPQHNYRRRDQIHIYPLDIQIADYAYQGTIMEAVYYRNEEGVRNLIVDEVRMLTGVDQFVFDKVSRMQKVDEFLSQGVRLSTQYQIRAANMYKTSESMLRELHRIILHQTIDRMHGVIFWPMMGKDVPYYYSIVERDLEDEIVKVSTLTMSRSLAPDVYDLMHPDTDVHIGIALIPDTYTSGLCKAWFKKKSLAKINVICQLDLVKGRWIPLRLA